MDILQVITVLTTMGYTWFKFFGEEHLAPDQISYPDEALPPFLFLFTFTLNTLSYSGFAARTLGVVGYTIMVAFMYDDMVLNSFIPKQRPSCDFHEPWSVHPPFNPGPHNLLRIKDVYIPVGYNKNDTWTFIDQVVCTYKGNPYFTHVVTPDVFSEPGTDFFIPSLGDDMEIASREDVTLHVITPDTDMCARLYSHSQIDSIGRFGAEYLTLRFKDSGKPIQLAIYGATVDHQSVTIKDMVEVVAKRIRCKLTPPT